MCRRHVVRKWNTIAAARRNHEVGMALVDSLRHVLAQPVETLRPIFHWAVGPNGHRRVHCGDTRY